MLFSQTIKLHLLGLRQESQWYLNVSMTTVEKTSGKNMKIPKIAGRNFIRILEYKIQKELDMFFTG